MRRPIFGRVEGAKGPIADATVVWVGHHTGAMSDKDADVVITQTKDGGRYRADVIAGMPYFGFVTGAWKEGHREGSSVRGWFGAGATVDFTCRERIASRTVDVRGLEAWQQGDALRVLARPQCSESGPQISMPFAIEMVRDADGFFSWPSMPLGRVEAVGQDSMMVWSSAQSVRDAVDFAVPPPSDFACMVTDEMGAPILGAMVHLRVDGRYDSGIDGIETTRVVPMRLVARTDENGRASMRLPFSGKLFALPAAPARMFVATALGYADQFCGVRGNDVFQNGEKSEPPADGVLRFAMREAKAVVGVVDSGLRGAHDNARLQLRHVGMLRVGDGAYLHDPRVAASLLLDGGAFAIEGLPAEMHEHQWLVQPSWHEPPILLRRREGAARTDELLQDLAALGDASLVVFDSEAGPAVGQCVYAVRNHSAHDPRARGPWDAVRLVTDAGGRLRVRLGSGSWILVAVSERAYGRVACELEPGTTSEAEMRMQSFPMMRVLVQDRAGAPIAGASAVIRQGSSKGWQSSSGDELLSQWTMRVVPSLGGSQRSAADGLLEVRLPVFRDALEAEDAQDQERSQPKISLTIFAPNKRSEIVAATYSTEPVKVVLR